ncbi:phosphotransferase enzyme family protein [Westerdykella ornata]|uniref:Altered inheritance of mitochondria protein 9, mitochondrial n=1 Tax=Westerdykella ornata TaxID=318751 RepID=A0A6A6J7I9_WESOR|nr:phosphotransferase enzyme family protein [Westerdykella ornata]KAF2272167.1 phosphotransferase enzyme family protein [Westerdykella ornata]
MDDGRDVIAKLPNPNAGRAHFTTDSEAATMDYVRNVLGIPAPRVYGWSSSTDNPVRAEYILMEGSGGVELGRLWNDMSWKERLEIVRTLAGYEKAFVSAKIPMNGSLYYAKDLPSPSPSQFLDPANSIDKAEAFVVGPTTNRAFFDQGRDSVEFNSGPWPSEKEYILSRAARELACINKSSSFPGQHGLFGGPNQYRPSKALKIRVLQDYLKVATQILPDDANLSKPTLWHSDLHIDNIFVDPSQPTRIVNIIDWQAVNISPLFLQACHPSLIEFEGPIPEGSDPTELPDNFDDMSEEEQLQAKNLRAAQSLYKLYEIIMLRQCPEIADALQFRASLRGQITGLAGSIFCDGEPIVLGMLIRLQAETQQQRLEASWSAGVELMHEILTEIGAYQGWDGWVNHSNYPVYKERLARCREDFLNRFARTEEERSQWIQAWPFEDKTHPSTCS